MATILAIDDTEIALVARKKVLERAGYKVLAARDATEALRVFESGGIDLVLMDYHLPGGSSEVRRRMKAAKPAVPIVILSGAIELPEDMSHADLFLSKLDGPDTVLATVADLLHHPDGGKATA